MARHAEFTTATDIPVYFCDPASPWQFGKGQRSEVIGGGADVGGHYMVKLLRRP